MSTIETKPDIDLHELADQEAAERHFIAGTPFEPDLARRIQERSAKISEETFNRIGYIDVDQLIHETRDGL
jgi:hypothetical protein